MDTTYLRRIYFIAVAFFIVLAIVSIYRSTLHWYAGGKILADKLENDLQDETVAPAVSVASPIPSTLQAVTATHSQAFSLSSTKQLEITSSTVSFTAPSKYDFLYEGVKNELIQQKHPNDYWYVINKTAIVPETISQSSQSPTRASGIKLIYGATKTYITTWEDMLSFKGCIYDNCIVRSSLTFKYIEEADVVLYYFREIHSYPYLNQQQRANQLWVLYTDESQGYGFNHFPAALNHKFNATMTYRPDSDIPYPYGRAVLKTKIQQNDSFSKNYAKGKTKGAFAYVSNCGSENYNRINYMKSLRNYIPVDIFGTCFNYLPCKRADWECEDRVHSGYHFYLSFENSLCKDYITEKFWSRLESPHAFIPVAYGGLDVSEYEKVAPPDSFIHAYNFTSLEKLGKYLQYLMANETAYNQYHVWRQAYRIETWGYINTCKLCELANTKPNMPAKPDVAEWWNREGSCKNINLS